VKFQAEQLCNLSQREKSGENGHKSAIEVDTVLFAHARNTTISQYFVNFDFMNKSEKIYKNHGEKTSAHNVSFDTS
jgi:hypothetical protein